MNRRAFAVALSAILLAGLAIRVGYVLTQRRIDPQFAQPMLDGRVYLEWGRDLAAGRPGPAGAYYLAPLYPFILAGAMKAVGESFTAIYLVQHAAVLACAAFLGLYARREAGEAAGLATAALLLLYHPILFFGSRPMGESIALLALAVAVYLGGARTTGRMFPAGVAVGLSALARPNLLLVPAVWAALLVRRAAHRRAALLIGGVLIVVAPVVLRNAIVSGHLVAVSSNGGVTLYHGNGPGALGVYTSQAGFSGDAVTQRDEATALARLRSGRNLDPVEADRWFGRQAFRSRLADPLGTVRLVATRVMLLFDNYEHSLDYAPRLDENKWRHAAPLGFAVLLGLAAAGVGLSGFRGTGGSWLWGAIAAAAATPVIYYVSSRYRLPLAALLAVPAGVGAARLAGGGPAASPTARARALAIALACGVVSLAVPSAGLARSEEAAALSNRAAAHQRNGDLASAESDARRAVARDPSSVPSQFALGAVLDQEGHAKDAEAAYRRALALDPGHTGAAGNLAKQLVLAGAPAEAVPLLRRALAAQPGDAVCWTNLVLALVALGDHHAARDAADEAQRVGVVLDPQVIEIMGRMNE